MYLKEAEAQAIINHIREHNAHNGPYFAAAVVYTDETGQHREIFFDPPVLGNTLSAQAKAKANFAFTTVCDTLSLYSCIAEREKRPLLDYKEAWLSIGAVLIRNSSGSIVAAIGVHGRRPFQEDDSKKAIEPHNHELAVMGRDFYEQSLRN